MAVRISKLWKDLRFQKLPKLTKLLYIYLSTNPGLTIVGVFTPNLEVVRIELGCTLDELRDSTKQLKDLGYIYLKKYDDILYFIIPEHFNTIPKSEASILKTQKTLKGYPDKLVSFLKTIGISETSKVRVFAKPTAKEITEYAMSQGYFIQGQTVIDYYEGQAERFDKEGKWIDSRGKEVRDWKAKVRRVWCKEENKLKKLEGAPEGFEYFYVEFQDKVAFPDGWRRGKPYSKNFAVDVELKKQYEERTKDS